MSDWLELELARHLAPVEAPAALQWKGFPPERPRWSFNLAPILALCAGAALVILASVPSRMGVDEANRALRTRAGIDLPVPPETAAQIESVRVVRARVAAVRYRMGEGEGTVFIARASAVSGPEWKAHGSYSIAGGCVLCHAKL